MLSACARFVSTHAQQAARAPIPEPAPALSVMPASSLARTAMLWVGRRPASSSSQGGRSGAGTPAGSDIGVGTGAGPREPATPAARDPTRVRGSVELICGPMFSGKTTELLRRLQRQQLAGRRVLLVKHAIDDRYGACNAPAAHGQGQGEGQGEEGQGEEGEAERRPLHVSEAVTHDNVRFRAIPAAAMGDVVGLPEVRAAEVIGVDEGQFFADLVPVVDALAFAGKRVIVAALDGTVRQEPFPATLALVSRAERVAKLLAVCRVCGHDAAFTVRHAAAARADQTVLVGGAESYMAVCRECVADHRAGAR